MKKRLLAGAMAVASIAALLAGCGGSGSSQAAGDATANTASAEGQVINIYSWNDEFRTRLEAVYPEVDHTSDDGTVTYLKDGTEIHWVINPNQDGVYQQKLDEALLNQATAAADDKIDIFLSETDYVYKYTDADALTPTWPTSTRSPRRRPPTRTACSAAPPGSAAPVCLSTGATSPRTSSAPTTPP